MPELSEAGAAEGFEVIDFAERRAGKPEAATLSEFAHTLRVGLGFREQPLVGGHGLQPYWTKTAAGKMPEIEGDDDICPGCIRSLDHMAVRRIDQWQRSERHFWPKPGQRLGTSQRKKLE